MAQFTLPNVASGGSITVNATDLASAQQAAANQTGVSLATQQGGGTFGAGTFGGGGGGGTAPGVAAPGSVAAPDTSGLAAFAAQTSGVTQAQLAQQKAEFDAQLNFAKDQMTQLGIPQLQINQFLAQMQQEQFQSQLALATQAQAYNQAATTAGITGYYTPPAGVPDTSGYTGQNIWAPGQQLQPGAAPQLGTAGGAAGGGGGSYSWNQLSQQLRSQAGGNYNDAAGKAAFQQAIGANPASFNGGQAANLSATQLNSILSAGSNGLLGGAMATAMGGGGSATSWNQLSQQLQAQAGANYNDAAGKAAFQQAIGANPQNFNGGQTVNLSQDQLNSILSAGSNGQIVGTPATGGATGTGATATGGPGQPAGSQMTMQLGQLLGQYNGTPTEAASEYARSLAEQQRQYNLTLQLQQGQLGQQYLSTAAQLQGPQNTFQLSNYLRGAQGNASVPTYLQNLANNVGMPMFQAPGTTAPTVQSAAGLASQLGGQTSATPGWDYNQTLGTIQNIMSQGAQKLGPGALESLTPDEMQAFGSGLGAAGGSLPSFMQAYNTSRVGQQAPVTQTRLS